MPRRRREPPWWLEGDLQICPICYQRYPLEMEHRCASCDMAMCALCALTEHGVEITCIECRQTAPAS